MTPMAANPFWMRGKNAAGVRALLLLPALGCLPV